MAQRSFVVAVPLCFGGICMIPPCRPSVEWLKSYSMEKFHLSQKKHLLITGQKQIGKSTLFAELLPTGAPALLSGLILKEGQPKSVYLCPPTNGMRFIIGHRGENKMRPNTAVLNSIGVCCAQQLLESSSKIVGIDEIGFLEQSSLAYQKALLSVFYAKSVIAVVRKDSHAFLQELLLRSDCFVLDLDEVCQQKCFCMK